MARGGVVEFYADSGGEEGGVWEYSGAGVECISGVGDGLKLSSWVWCERRGPWGGWWGEVDVMILGYYLYCIFERRVGRCRRWVVGKISLSLFTKF